MVRVHENGLNMDMDMDIQVLLKAGAANDDDDVKKNLPYSKFYFSVKNQKGAPKHKKNVQKR